MSLKSTQHQRKCYCNSNTSTCCNSKTNCFKRQGQQQQQPTQTGRTAGRSALATTRKPTSRAAPTKTQQSNFVKVKRVVQRSGESVGNGSCNGSVKSSGGSSSLVYNNRRGCGHSQPNYTHFSRRNSAATTVTFSSPCASPAEAYSSTGAPTKVASNYLGERVALSPECGIRQEYTEQRRYYESAQQLMALVATTQQQSNGGARDNGCAGGDGNTGRGCGVDEARLRALQQFRLQNANDCFNVHRQQDLRLQPQQGATTWTNKLQQAQEIVAQTSKRQGKRESLAPAKSNKELKNSLEKDERLTPYAVRQKLLQLRLEAEAIGRLKPGRKLYGSLEKSCALRFQETY